MAWRTGFFRIWVVVSSIWIISIAFITYESIASPWVPERAFVFRASLADMRKQAKYASMSEEQLADAIYRDLYPDMPRDEFDAKIEQAGRGEPTVVEGGKEYRELETLVAAGKLSKIEIIGVPDIFAYLRSDSSKERNAARMKEIYPLALNLRNSIVADKRKEAILGALGAALAVPGVFLALGLAIGWAIAGFRRA